MTYEAVQLPVVALTTDEQADDLEHAFHEARDRADAAAAQKRARYDAFWRAVGLTEDQPDTFVERRPFDDEFLFT